MIEMKVSDVALKRVLATMPGPYSEQEGMPPQGGVGVQSFFNYVDDITMSRVVSEGHLGLPELKKYTIPNHHPVMSLHAEPVDIPNGKWNISIPEEVLSASQLSEPIRNDFRDKVLETKEPDDINRIPHEIICSLLGGNSDKKIWAVYDLPGGGPLDEDMRPIGRFSPDFILEGPNNRRVIEIATSKSKRNYMQKYVKYVEPLCLAEHYCRNKVDWTTLDVILVSRYEVISSIPLHSQQVQDLTCLYRSAVDIVNHILSLSVGLCDVPNMGDDEFDNLGANMKELKAILKEFDEMPCTLTDMSTGWISKDLYTFMTADGNSDKCKNMFKNIRGWYNKEMNEQIQKTGARVGNEEKFIRREKKKAVDALKQFDKNMCRGDNLNMKMRLLDDYACVVKVPLLCQTDSGVTIAPRMEEPRTSVEELWYSAISGSSERMEELMGAYESTPEFVQEFMEKSENNFEDNNLVSDTLEERRKRGFIDANFVREENMTRLARKGSTYRVDFQISNEAKTNLAVRGFNRGALSNLETKMVERERESKRNRYVDPDSDSYVIDRTLAKMEMLMNDENIENRADWIHEDLINKSLENYDSSVTHDYALEKSIKNCTLGRFFALYSTIATELSTSFKSGTRKDEILLKPIPGFAAWVLVKSVNYGKQVYASFAFSREHFSVVDTEGVFSRVTESGNMYITPMYSFTDDKMHNFIHAQSMFISLTSHYRNKYRTDPSDVLCSSFPTQCKLETCLAMLVYCEDNARTEKVMTISRYVCMDRFKSKLVEMNYTKMLNKVPLFSRTIMEHFASNRLRETMLDDRYGLDECKDINNRTPNFTGMKHPFLRFELSHFDQLVESWYIGYAKNKDEEHRENQVMSLVTKIINPENEWRNTDKETMGDCSINIFNKDGSYRKIRKSKNLKFKRTIHSWNRMFLKFACHLKRMRMVELEGVHWEKTFIQNIARDFASVEWTDIATGQACSEFDSDDKIYINKQGKHVVKGKKLLPAIMDLARETNCMRPSQALPILMRRIKKAAKFDLHMFPKKQHGGEREIFVMRAEMRVLQYFIERIARRLCESYEMETITHPKNKITIPLGQQAKVMEDASSNYVSTFESADKTKWSQGLSADKIAARLVGVLPRMFHGFILQILSMWREKRIRFPKALMDKLHKEKRDVVFTEPDWQEVYLSWKGLDSEDSKYRDIIPRDRNYIKASSGFMQGILHINSSDYHCDMINMRDTLFKEYCKRNNLNVITFNLCSSDDSSRGYYIKTSKAEGVSDILQFIGYMASIADQLVSEPLNKLCGMQNSEKSTYGSDIVMEFNSNWFVNLSVYNPEVKFVFASSTMVEAESFYERQEQTYTLLSQCAENGIPLRVCRSINYAQSLSFYRVLGMFTHVVGEYMSERMIKYPSPMVGFFLMDHPIAPGVSGLQFAHYLHLLKNESVSAIYKRSFVQGELYLTSTGVLANPICLRTRTREKHSELIEEVNNTYPDFEIYAEKHPKIYYTDPANMDEVLVKLCLKAMDPSIMKSINKGKSSIVLCSHASYALSHKCFTKLPIYHTNRQEYMKLVRSIEEKYKIHLFDDNTRMENDSELVKEFREKAKQELDKDVKEFMDKNKGFKRTTLSSIIAEDLRYINMIDLEDRSLLLDDSDMIQLFPLNQSYESYNDQLAEVLGKDRELRYTSYKIEKKTKCSFIVHSNENSPQVSLHTICLKEWYGIKQRNVSSTMSKEHMNYYSRIFKFLGPTEQITFDQSGFTSHKQLHDFIQRRCTNHRKFVISGAPISNRTDKLVRVLILYMNQYTGYKLSHVMSETESYVSQSRAIFLNRVYMLSISPISDWLKNTILRDLIKNMDYDDTWSGATISSVPARYRSYSIFSKIASTNRGENRGETNQINTDNLIDHLIRKKVGTHGWFSNDTDFFLTRHEKDAMCIDNMGLLIVFDPNSDYVQDNKCHQWTGIVDGVKIKFFWYGNVMYKVETNSFSLFKMNLEQIRGHLYDLKTKFFFEYRPKDKATARVTSFDGSLRLTPNVGCPINEVTDIYVDSVGYSGRNIRIDHFVLKGGNIELLQPLGRNSELKKVLSLKVGVQDRSDELTRNNPYFFNQAKDYSSDARIQIPEACINDRPLNEVTVRTTLEKDDKCRISENKIFESKQLSSLIYRTLVERHGVRNVAQSILERDDDEEDKAKFNAPVDDEYYAKKEKELYEAAQSNEFMGVVNKILETTTEEQDARLGLDYNELYSKFDMSAFTLVQREKTRDDVMVEQALIDSGFSRSSKCLTSWIHSLVKDTVSSHMFTVRKGFFTNSLMNQPIWKAVSLCKDRFNFSESDTVYMGEVAVKPAVYGFAHTEGTVTVETDVVAYREGAITYAEAAMKAGCDISYIIDAFNSDMPEAWREKSQNTLRLERTNKVVDISTAEKERINSMIAEYGEMKGKASPFVLGAIKEQLNKEIRGLWNVRVPECLLKQGNWAGMMEGHVVLTEARRIEMKGAYEEHFPDSLQAKLIDPRDIKESKIERKIEKIDELIGDEKESVEKSLQRLDAPPELALPPIGELRPNEEDLRRTASYPWLKTEVQSAGKSEGPRPPCVDTNFSSCTETSSSSSKQKITKGKKVKAGVHDVSKNKGDASDSDVK